MRNESFGSLRLFSHKLIIPWLTPMLSARAGCETPFSILSSFNILPKPFSIDLFYYNHKKIAVILTTVRIGVCNRVQKNAAKRRFFD